MFGKIIALCLDKFDPLTKLPAVVNDSVKIKLLYEMLASFAFMVHLAVISKENPKIKVPGTVSVTFIPVSQLN